MRSGMTECDAPESSSTPSMTIRGLPSPVILAPMERKRRATSTTSGSHAAPSITVRPLARVAAHMTFSVAPTLEPLGPPRKIVAPVSRSALTVM